MYEVSLVDKLGPVITDRFVIRLVFVTANVITRYFWVTAPPGFRLLFSFPFFSLLKVSAFPRQKKSRHKDILTRRNAKLYFILQIVKPQLQGGGGGGEGLCH